MRRTQTQTQTHHVLQLDDVHAALQPLWALLGLDPEDVLGLGITPGAITATAIDHERPHKRYLSRTQHIWLVKP